MSHPSLLLDFLVASFHHIRQGIFTTEDESVSKKVLLVIPVNELDSQAYPAMAFFRHERDNSTPQPASNLTPAEELRIFSIHPSPQHHGRTAPIPGFFHDMTAIPAANKLKTAFCVGISPFPHNAVVMQIYGWLEISMYGFLRLQTPSRHSVVLVVLEPTFNKEPTWLALQ